MKKTVAAVLSILLVIFSLPIYALASTAEFTDVKKGSWYYDAVIYAKENGIMDGVSNNEFAPKDAMTRASFVTVLWAIAGKPDDSPCAEFCDVPENAWYADAVNWAYENGIAAGTGEDTFTPERPLRRAEACTMLVKYNDTKGGLLLYKLNPQEFADVQDIPEWARDAVTKCRRAELISGVGGNTFAPKKTLTRAEAAVMLSEFIRPKGFLFLGNSLTYYYDPQIYFAELCDIFCVSNNSMLWAHPSVYLSALAEGLDYETEFIEKLETADAVIMQEGTGTDWLNDDSHKNAVLEIMGAYKNNKLTYIRFTEYDIWNYQPMNFIEGTDDIFSGYAHDYLLMRYPELYQYWDLHLDDGYSHPTETYAFLIALTCFVSVFNECDFEIKYEDLSESTRATLIDEEHYNALWDAAIFARNISVYSNN
ncbi:MAG: S-layer homology domain-containing protein [Clostridia bacterium]|nr:S-layer homology domain-containing protein [Clostridia bacterium]